MKKGPASEKIKRDAKGQFARSQHGRDNDGVISASPRATTGTDDATFDTDPRPLPKAALRNHRRQRKAITQ